MIQRSGTLRPAQPTPFARANSASSRRTSSSVESADHSTADAKTLSSHLRLLSAYQKGNKGEMRRQSFSGKVAAKASGSANAETGPRAQGTPGLVDHIDVVQNALLGIGDSYAERCDCDIFKGDPDAEERVSVSQAERTKDAELVGRLTSTFSFDDPENHEVQQTAMELLICLTIGDWTSALIQMVALKSMPHDVIASTMAYQDTDGNTLMHRAVMKPDQVHEKARHAEISSMRREGCSKRVSNKEIAFEHSASESDQVQCKRPVPVFVIGISIGLYVQVALLTEPYRHRSSEERSFKNSSTLVRKMGGKGNSRASVQGAGV